ncbi:YbbR-like domain-containing protein [Flavobacteriaceae bacterium F89]|uniref:YbbR-like domain-containing protein n=1 Tax=Cerina litoralis TaxID=2874477 RepID=A0AAE3EU23_9FLAO|nr:YbbR-like domain-containing protein [Cerina litoralis]MCG2461105.1 YbbR-like domain-containing protein [Cerina litoralis]
MKNRANGWNNRKVKVFSFFLACSALLWFISNLSETYVGNTTFKLVYTNVPDSLSLAHASKDKIDVQLRARGFQFFGFSFSPKTINIDLSQVKKGRDKYFIPEYVYKNQIERKLPLTMTLLNMDSRDTLFFEFNKLYTKLVPVFSKVKIDLEQNYLLDGKLTISPDSVTVKGPSRELDTITGVWTEPRELDAVNADFSILVPLHKFKALKNTTFSSDSVGISAKIYRFSEKIIQVPVTVLNLPKDVEIKTFPDKVPVLCRGKLEQLKNLNPIDFRLVANYDSITEGGDATLNLVLKKIPNNIQSAVPLEMKVEYILKK